MPEVYDDVAIDRQSEDSGTGAMGFPPLRETKKKMPVMRAGGRNLQAKKNGDYFFSSGFLAFFILQLKNINAGANLRLIVGTVHGRQCRI